MLRVQNDTDVVTGPATVLLKRALMVTGEPSMRFLRYGLLPLLTSVFPPALSIAPASAQVAVLSGAATETFGTYIGGKPANCQVQLNITLLTFDTSGPMTWNEIVHYVANAPANEQYFNGNLSGTAAWSGPACTSLFGPTGALTILPTESRWSLQNGPDVGWYFDFAYGSGGIPNDDNAFIQNCGSIGDCQPGNFLQVSVNGLSGTCTSTPSDTSNLCGAPAATICLGVGGSACSGGTTSNTPMIASLSPSSASAGGSAFTLTVNGTNFASGAALEWNGTTLPTTFITSTKLTASVSSGLIASAGTASISVSSGGQISAPMTFTISPSSGGSSVNVVTKLTSNTNGIVNGSCVTPPSITSFTTTSPQVFLYFDVNGARSTDTVAINFVRPDGLNYQSYNSSSLNGSECYSPSINISGTSAATYPGTWAIQVFWNNSSAPLFTLHFTIVPVTGGSGGVTFTDQRVSTQDTSASSTCVVPPAASSFLTTNKAVYLYFSATTTTNDSLSDNWLAPDGTVINGVSWTPPIAGIYCYLDSLDISNLPINQVGSWQARVYDHGNLLFSIQFTVAAPQTLTGPVITAVSNAASYVPGIVAPGEIVYIAGSGMGPTQIATLTLNSAGLVSTQLAGTSVQFDGVAAPLIYTLATAVGAVVPYGISGTTAQVTVAYQGQISAPFQVSVASSVPGLFTTNSSGSGQLAALNQDGSVNGSGHLAAPGSYITLFATGEGQTSPSGVDGKLGAVPLPSPLLPVSVTIGGNTANVSYAGAAPGEVAGVIQINAQIPGSVSGTAVPVVLKVGNAQSQSGATIAVTGQSTMGSPASIQIVSGNSQTASLNQAFSAPLIIRVTDFQGNAVSGAAINWAVSQGTATLFNSATSTNAGGQASTNITAGSSAGTVIVTVAAGSVTAQFTLTIAASGATIVSVNSSGQKVTNGRDNTYQILGDTTGEIAAPATAFVVTSLPGGWAPIPGAAWIGPSADQSNATRNPCCVNTSDTYRTTVAVSGDPSRVQLNLTLAADDYVDVLLNGNSVFAHPNIAMWTTPVTFSINSGFVSGTNTLDFVVTNAGGPTGLIVAVNSSTPGQSQVTPGQTLTINGNFNPTATTTVIFAAGGYQMSIIPLAITNNAVTVLVPPHVDPQQFTITAGTLNVSVVQQPTGGSSTTTGPYALTVGDLPSTGVAPGLLTLNLLQQLSTLAATANQTWAQIAQKSNGVVNASPLNFLSLKGDIDADAADIQSLIAGNMSQISLGQVNGRNVYIDLNGLALLDRFYYAYFVGSGSSATVPNLRAYFLATAGQDPLTNFQNSLHDLFSNELPATIRANASKLRTIGSIGIAVGALVLSGPAATVAIGGGAILWGVSVLVSASTTVVSETAGAAVTGNPPSISDFKNTIGIFIDGYWDALVGALKDKIAGLGGAAGERANAIVDIGSGVIDLMNPNDPTTPAGQVANDTRLFNAGLPLTGAWTGTYNRTPSSGCPPYSGLLSMTTTEASDGTYSGTISMTNINTYDASCRVIEVGNITNGYGISGRITGLDAKGDPTFKGTMQASFDNSLTDITFTFTATLADGSINGVFDNNGGTFDVH